MDAVTDESDTTNNCSTSVQVTVQQTVTEAQGDPDLTVTSAAVNNSGPIVGAKFTLSATVKNGGDGGAETTTLRYYRSADATITSADTEVGADTITGLAASGSASESAELTAPSTPGTYYYGACVDAVTDESNTTNNCSTSVQVTVPQPARPDLMVTSPSVSDSGPANRRTVHAVRFGDERWEWQRGGYDVALLPVVGQDDRDIRHAGRYGRDLGACRFRERRPVGGADGAVDARHVLLRCVCRRGDGRVGHDEQLFGIRQGRHIAARSRCGGAVGPQERPRGRCAVHTLGDRGEQWRGGVGCHHTALLLLDRHGDYDIRTRRWDTDAIGGLAASGTSSQSVDLTAPETPGTYYYGACVDAVTDESDTTNNCSTSVQVTVPQPKPDLVVGLPSVDDDGPAAGAAFALSATVENDGEGSRVRDDPALLPVGGRGRSQRRTRRLARTQSGGSRLPVPAANPWI